MEAKLTLKYDREADILYINKCAPYAEQESEEVGDDVVARLNPIPVKSRTSRSCSFRRGSCAATCWNCPLAARLWLADDDRAAAGGAPR